MLLATHPVLAEDGMRRWPIVALDLSVGCAANQPVKIRSDGQKEDKAFYLFGELSKNTHFRLLNFLSQALKVVFNLT